jgi:hypothetical protein
MQAFYIIQKKKNDVKSCIFLQALLPYIILGPQVNGTPTSHVCSSTALILLTAGN